MFAMHDNGIGIAPESRADLRIFQRLHPEGEYPGSGIGLAICRRSSSATAAVSGSTRRPVGSTFLFSLPARPEASNRRGL